MNISIFALEEEERMSWKVVRGGEKKRGEGGKRRREGISSYGLEIALWLCKSYLFPTCLKSHLGIVFFLSKL